MTNPAETKASADYPIKFWLAFGLLFLVVLALNGKPVPFNNEPVYLLRLRPDLLQNDWTLSRQGHEHWLFNLIFSFPARALSLEAVGWMGRILTWTLCLIPLIKLGRQFAIRYWMIFVAIGVWLAYPQGTVNLEWIFGGFEAKTISYACLLFSLYLFSNGRFVLPSILLGLSFSFHPAVGLWAIPAVGCALLLERVSAKNFVTVVILTGAFALFGILPPILENSGTVAVAFDDWRFIVTTVLPFHLDPFYFDKREVALLFAMLAFNVAALWRSPLPQLRFLTKFQLLLGIFFASGFILRALEFYPALLAMPMRLLPVFTPLFFIFTAFHFIPRIESAATRVKLTAFAVAVIALSDPFKNSVPNFTGTIRSWRKPATDLQRAYQWVSKNTETDALVLSPPPSKEMWYESNRAAVVSYHSPTFDRVAEWRARVADLTDDVELAPGEAAYPQVLSAFNNLSTEKIERLSQKYGADYLISTGVYPYPLLFETATYKIYRLPKSPEK